MKTFSVFGTIVDNDREKTSFEDTTPSQFLAFTKKLKDKEPLEIVVNSYGGSVVAGIAIANMIKSLNAKGHETTCRVDGLAASIATVIMCACQKIVMNESSMIMIHNCWGVVQGDANTLRKEADTMDMMNEAIMSFYHSKFDLTDEQLKQYMNDELWFSGREAKNFGFKCEVVPDENDFKIAAKVEKFNLSKFKDIPKELQMKNKQKSEELEEKKVVETEEVEETETVEAEEVVEETEEETEEVEEETVVDKEESETTEDDDEEVEEETVVDEVEETETTEEETEEDDEEETVPKAEVEKRVSGMQSTMAKKINALKKEFNAKIKDLVCQLKDCQQELTSANAKVINLTETLEKSKNELQTTVSALMEKENALAMLNAGVNTPNEHSTHWKNLKGQAFFDYLKKHPELTK